MKNTIIDAGPLIALFDRDDAYHSRIVASVRTYSGRFVSTWPVVTEAMHILRRFQLNQLSLLQWISSGGVQIANLDTAELPEMMALFGKYADVPMDFADCSIVQLAAKSGIHDIFTIDSDFTIYRVQGNKNFRFLAY